MNQWDIKTIFLNNKGRDKPLLKYNDNRVLLEYY